MNKIVWIMVIALLILHQDIWFWDDTRLVFGFMPITLLYHACISVAAGLTWFMATRFYWPSELDTEPFGPEEGGTQP